MDLSFLDSLNEEQKEAVTHRQGPLLIVAGAGTGKTMVITHRIAWLIAQGLAKPEEILALTFTDKAAGEMEARVDRLLPYGYVNLSVSTFHAFCEKILRAHGVDMGLSRDTKLLNELDTWLLMRAHFDRFALDYYRPLGNSTKYLRALLTHFSRAKDHAVLPEEYLSYVQERRADFDRCHGDDLAQAEIARLEELARAYHTYQQILQEQDCFDFGDLLLQTLTLLRRRPQILQRLRDQYRFILVDEFQDTNHTQYELVKLLSAPANNLTVVGDDDQAIYKFRGASLANILAFENDFPDAKKVFLIKNYRSSQIILDHAYTLISQNNPHRLEARQGAGVSKKLVAHGNDPGIIEHLYGATAQDEVQLVMEKIEYLQRQDSTLSFGDIAILVRSNDSALPFIHALEHKKIPYQFHALRGLYRKPVIVDALAFLRVLDCPFDSVNLYRLLSWPLHGLAAETLAFLCQEADKQGKSLFEICRQARLFSDLPSKDVETMEALLQKISCFQQVAKTQKASELFVTSLREVGYVSFIQSFSEALQKDAYACLQQLYDRIRSFEERSLSSSLHDFLLEFSEELKAGEEGALQADPEVGPDVVHVMSVHASKGLEFPYVFLVHLIEQRFPTVSRQEAIPLPDALDRDKGVGEDWHIEEERRLFYVAMTRAKKGLFLCSAEDYGGARKRKASRFLQELGYASQKPVRVVSASSLFGVDTPSSSPSAVFSLPSHFSYTQLAAYEACPLQYKYAHLLKIPVPGKASSSFGRTMHETLRLFFAQWIERRACAQGSLFGEVPSSSEAGLPVSLEELLRLYEEQWQDDWYRDEKERATYRAQGKKSLQSYYKILEQERPTPLHVEQAFTYKLGPYVLKGRIDRIDTKEGGVEIIDYKTGRPKKEESITREQKEQLWLYQMAVQEVLGLKPVALTYHYLEDHSHITFLGTEKQLEQAKESMLERLHALQEGCFEPKAGFACRTCDFADICESRE
jgi:DNA helicase-2/ATP-dependent DNA helicase PcrA